MRAAVHLSSGDSTALRQDEDGASSSKNRLRDAPCGRSRIGGASFINGRLVWNPFGPTSTPSLLGCPRQTQRSFCMTIKHPARRHVRLLGGCASTAVIALAAAGWSVVVPAFEIHIGRCAILADPAGEQIEPPRPDEGSGGLPPEKDSMASSMQQIARTCDHCERLLIVKPGGGVRVQEVTPDLRLPTMFVLDRHGRILSTREPHATPGTMFMLI